MPHTDVQVVEFHAVWAGLGPVNGDTHAVEHTWLRNQQLCSLRHDHYQLMMININICA